MLGRQAPLTIHCRPEHVEPLRSLLSLFSTLERPARAGVRRLILTHIGAEYHDEVDALAEEARNRFAGEVEIARELVPYPL